MNAEHIFQNFITNKIKNNFNVTWLILNNFESVLSDFFVTLKILLKYIHFCLCKCNKIAYTELLIIRTYVILSNWSRLVLLEQWERNPMFVIIVLYRYTELFNFFCEHKNRKKLFKVRPVREYIITTINSTRPVIVIMAFAFK